MPDSSLPSRAARPSGTGSASARRGARARARTADPFVRHIVGSLRNGVIAFHRDGRLALMNDEAYRIFALTRKPDDIGRPFADVLRERPAITRVLAGAFETSHLPDRAELRLKDLN